MFAEYIGTAEVATNVFNTISEYNKSKYPKQIINIYGSYNSFIEEDDISIIKFVCETYGELINTDISKYYIEGRISLYRVCKLYFKNFFEIIHHRKDLNLWNRVILAWHKANFKTHRTVNFCSVESYIGEREKYNEAFKLKFKVGAINNLRLVRFLDIIPENYYKAKSILKQLKKI